MGGGGPGPQGGGLPGASPGPAPGASPGATSPGGGSGPGPQAPTLNCTKPDPGRSPLRRLNHVEYVNTVADLLNLPEATELASTFPPDEQGGGFSNNADALVVTGLLAGRYVEVAEQLAAVAVTKAKNLLPCDPTQGEAACAAMFVQRFGRRAFRRPLRAEEQTRYLALYMEERKAGTFTSGIEVVTRALLVSPHFLYRVEVGVPMAGATVVAVTPYELASRLSYGLWSTMPDDTLLAAADAGRLGTPEGIEAEARRMLTDNKAKQAIAGFHREWFGMDEVDGIGKDKADFPTWTPSLRSALKTELELFVEKVFWTDGKIETLLAAPFTYLNPVLAKHYGAPMPNSSTEFSRVDLDPTQRAGLLTNGALLAVHAKPNQTSPVHRGVFVREGLLCQPLPAPPAVDAAGNPIVIQPPVVTPGSSTRQRFTQHSTDPSCASCHRLMDPIGFGFENYDSIGRWRTMDGEAPVDARGEVVGTREVDGKFTGAIELAKRLAASVDVRECMAKQVFRYASGRAETPGDACTLQRLRERFDSRGHDMRELWVAVAASDAFRYRAVSGGGQ